MNSNTRNFKIGIFVLVGLIILTIGIVLFGGGKLFREKYVIETYFDQSVQGLDVGAPLKFQGVEVGTVSQIHFVFNDYKTTDKQYVLVRADVYEDSFRGGEGRRLADEYNDIGTFLDILIQKGLRLQLSPQGITGVAFLNMVYVDPNKFQSLEIDWKPKYIYVPSSPGTITIIAQAVENLSENIDLLIAKLQKSIDDANIAQLSEDLITLINNLNDTSTSLNSVLESKEFNSSMEHIQSALSNIDSATTDLPQTVDNLSKTILTIKRLSVRQHQGLDEIIQDLKHSTESIRDILDTGKRQPSWILFGDPPPPVNVIKDEK